MSERADMLRVLVIDDDPGVIAVLHDGLHLVGGYEVLIARDGAHGLESVYETEPDCIVVDVRMPGLNGFQFVRALRGDPATAQKPIILLSALVQDRDELAGMLSGADAYLFKPIKMADLLRALQNAMELTARERRERLERAQLLTEEDRSLT